MKKKLITTMASLLVCSVGYSQENNVVLDYDAVGVGYLHHNIDVEGIELDANGVGLGISKRYDNLVVSFGLTWSSVDIERVSNDLLTDVGLDQSEINEVNDSLDLVDIRILQIGGGIGYVYELSDSLHLVPSVGIDYEQFEVELFGLSADLIDSWVVTPSLSLNYAATEKLELSLGVGYSEPFSTEILGEDIDNLKEYGIRADGGFAGGLSAEYAINNDVGLGVRAAFAEDQTVFGIGLLFHY